ncbi:MAG: PsbP-related protein [Leptolyngbyaceae cyanobacterium bins.302]|nr:PsbP-related protein [Leptolyngbyaceae cyanobacterium bins.302]
MSKSIAKTTLPVLLGSLLLTSLPAFNPTVQAQPSPQPAPGQTAGQWVAFKSDQGGFSISMPTQPTERVQTLKTAAGDINTYLFSTTLNSGTVNYTVSYIDLPKGVESMPENLLLEAIAGGITGDERVKVLSERTIKLDSYNGREIKVESQNKSIVQHRAYLVKQRIYQLAVEVPATSESKLAADVERFLNSFKLLN